MTIVAVLLTVAGTAVFTTYQVDRANKKVVDSEKSAGLRTAANRIEEIPSQDPFSAEKGTLLGIELLKRFDSIHVHSMEAINALRNNLRFLPKFIGLRKEFYGDFAISDDGKYIGNWWDYTNYKNCVISADNAQVVLDLSDQPVDRMAIWALTNRSVRYCVVQRPDQLQIWDLTRHNKPEILHIKNRINGFVISKDGEQLVVWTENTLYNYELADLSPASPAINEHVVAAAFLPDNTLAALSLRGTVTIYANTGGKLTAAHRFTVAQQANGIACSPNGKFIIVFQSDSPEKLMIYDYPTGKFNRAIGGLEPGKNDWGMNDQFLLAVMKSGGVRQIGWATNQSKTIDNFDAVSADGEYMWQLTDESSLQLLLQNSGDEQQHLFFANSGISTITANNFSNDIEAVYSVKNHVFIKTSDNTLSFWENPSLSGDIKLRQPAPADQLILNSSKHFVRYDYYHYRIFDLDNFSPLANGQITEKKNRTLENSV